MKSKNNTVYLSYFEKELSKLGFIKEYRFSDKRRFRFDYAYENKKIAIEIEGGIWIYGRHNNAKGYKRDMEKYNLAVLNGWRVLRFTYNDINGEYVDNTLNIIRSIL